MDPSHPLSVFAEQNINTDNFYQILESHRKSCQREGRFDEAELTRQRIIELRSHEEAIKRSQIQARHQAERASLMEAHKMEMQTLNEKWEESVPQFEEAAKEAIMKLRDKHRQELERFKEQKEQEVEKMRNHPPPDVLNLRRRVETMAAAVTPSQGEYHEAKKVRAKLLEAEETWQVRIQDRLNEKFQDLYDKVLEKQDREIEAQVSKLKK